MLGASGFVVFRATSSSRVVSVTADLIGDGDSGWTVEPKGAGDAVAGVWYTPAKRGTFGLVITAVDACGLTGSTGQRRDVVVR